MQALQDKLVRVCLVEDNVFESKQFQRWMLTAGTIRLTGVFTDVETAVAEARDGQVDVAILDYGLPGIKGGAAIELVKQQQPAVRVLVVTGIPDDYVIFDALEAGADGLIHKDGLTATKLVSAIRDTYEGKAPLSARARRMILEKLQCDSPARELWNLLTDREKEIALRLKRGLPNKEIANDLNCAESTVHFHLSNIFAKLQVHDRYAAQVKLWGGGEINSSGPSVQNDNCD